MSTENHYRIPPPAGSSPAYRLPAQESNPEAIYKSEQNTNSTVRNVEVTRPVMRVGTKKPVMHLVLQQPQTALYNYILQYRPRWDIDRAAFCGYNNDRALQNDTPPQIDSSGDG